MEVGTIMILGLICLICRCIMFTKRDMKWWHAAIPGVNKYKLGKSVGCKKIAIVNGIIHPVLGIWFGVCLGIEYYIYSLVANYVISGNYINDLNTEYINVTVPANSATGFMNVAVPESVLSNGLITFDTVSKYVLIGIAVIAFIAWSMMMWQFDKAHKKNPWWICLWAIIPVVPYMYFANSMKFAVNGKRYKLEKVEIRGDKDE